MHPATTALVATVRAADRVAPAIAGRLALPLFRQVRPRAAGATRRPRGARAREQRHDHRARARDRHLLVGSAGPRPCSSCTAGVVAPRSSPRSCGSSAPRASASSASTRPRTATPPVAAPTSATTWPRSRRAAAAPRDVPASSSGTRSARWPRSPPCDDGTAAGGVVAIAGMADARYLVDSFAARVGVGRGDRRRARAAVRPPRGPRPARAVRPRRRRRTPLPADVPLLVVHDRGDREVAASESLRLHDAHGDRSRLVLTDGAGHARVLGADATLDAVTAFATGGLPGARPCRARGARARGIRLSRSRRARPTRVRPARAPRRPRA